MNIISIHWMSTFFGRDPKAIFSERPAIVPIEISPEGRIRPLLQTAAFKEKRSSSGHAPSIPPNRSRSAPRTETNH